MTVKLHILRQKKKKKKKKKMKKELNTRNFKFDF